VRRATRYAATVFAFVLVLGLASRAPDRAYAQDASGDVAQAREHFELGVHLIEQGRWQEAVLELEAARRIHATGPVLYNLGIAHRGVGHAQAAIAAFREFLTSLGTGGSAARRAEVDGYIHELEGELAQLRVVTTPASATLVVDDVPAALDGDHLVLDPGTHRLRIEAAGYEPAFRDVTLERGGRETIDVALEEIETRGHLVVESATSGAIVRVDGEVVGAPPYDARLEPGTHELVVSAPGHVELRRQIEIAVGEDLRIEADLPDDGNILTSPWLWVGVGTVVAGVVTFAVLGAVGAFTTTEPPVVGDLGIVTGALVVRP
jgi:hypothetical protein